MFFLLGLFNSIIFMFTNVVVGLYVCRRTYIFKNIMNLQIFRPIIHFSGGLQPSSRSADNLLKSQKQTLFFQVMRSHNKLVAEISEFNQTVEKSRSSLDYIGNKVSDAMKEIEGDINKELQITHRLTQLSSQLTEANQRFTNLEESVIELVRTDYNMESVKIETPASINDEVKKVLSLKQQAGGEKKSKVQKKRKFSTTTFMGMNLNGSSMQNPPLKFTALPSLTETNVNPEEILSEDKWEEDITGRPRSAAIPVVQLLSEQRRQPEEKPIGFRPSWKCNA